MARQHGRSRFQSRGARRRVSWVFGPSGTFGTISTTSAVVSTTGLQLIAEDLTITRTRGELLLYLGSGDAIGSGFEWAFGMAVVSENAFGIGITAVPQPFDDIGWDGWFVYERGTLEAAGASVAGDEISTQSRVVIDSKAMRKTHATDVVVAVLQVNERGTATMRASLVSRVLVKLP